MQGNGNQRSLASNLHQVAGGHVNFIAERTGVLCINRSCDTFISYI